MAAFEYAALDGRGKQKRGVLEADSLRQTRQMLRDQGLVPLNVEPASERKTRSQGGGFSFARRLGALDRVLLTRQLATLVAASMPIEEALQAVAQQSEKQHVRALVMGIRSRVLEGHSLASSLAQYPGSFNDLYRSTVAAGEQSGYLDKVLDNLADYQERQFESRRDVEMAMLYPVVLTLLAFGIVGALMIYVVPDMVGVIENMGQELPTSTRVLIALSEWTQSYWWLLLIAVVLGVAGGRWLLAQPNVRLAWDRQKLGAPFISRITRSSNAARYANTLSILTSSGVPLVEAMNIAGEVVSNKWLQRRLTDATQRVSEGSSLRVALEGVGYFPPMLLHMVASGESSGELDSMLDKVARYQQSEVERIVTTLVRLFEPLMLVVMGGLVMFIVMAILLPILNMNQLV
ncbi:MAG: type II secretion system inner membrane protein GspF [Roseibium album]|uniref:type II secretion system inner membrane protein GspF n=1 Tax=Roseibium album TaxID=311410 RepID=UPI0032F08900